MAGKKVKVKCAEESSRRGDCRRKGSMTVEACIALPVFLMFFLLMLYFVNLCLLYLSLNHAVDQTTKYLAANSYLYEQLIPAEEERVQGMDERRARNAEGLDLSIIGNSMLDQLNGKLEEQATELIEAGGRLLLDDFLESQARITLGEFLQGSRLDSGQVELTLLKLPGRELIDKDDQIRSGAFEEDDVAIRATYKIKFWMPFLGEQELPVISTCVERAFMNGWNGEHMSLQDSSLF